MTTTDGTKKGRLDRATQGGMMVKSQVVLGFVKPEDSIGLMGWRGDGYGPKSIVHSTTSDDDLVIFNDLDVVLCEEGNAVIITELCERDQRARLELIKHKSSLGCGGKARRQVELAGHAG